MILAFLFRDDGPWPPYASQLSRTSSEARLLNVRALWSVLGGPPNPRMDGDAEDRPLRSAFRETEARITLLRCGDSRASSHLWVTLRYLSIRVRRSFVMCALVDPG